MRVCACVRAQAQADAAHGYADADLVAFVNEATLVALRCVGIALRCVVQNTCLRAPLRACVHTILTMNCTDAIAHLH